MAPAERNDLSLLRRACVLLAVLATPACAAEVDCGLCPCGSWRGTFEFEIYEEYGDERCAGDAISFEVPEAEGDITFSREVGFCVVFDEVGPVTRTIMGRDGESMDYECTGMRYVGIEPSTRSDGTMIWGAREQLQCVGESDRFSCGFYLRAMASSDPTREE